MKTNKGLPNRCIGDNNVGYNTKMEGYTTSMSDMNELYDIPPTLKFTNYFEHVLWEKKFILFYQFK